MKKFFILMSIFLVLLTGCQSNKPVETNNSKEVAQAESDKKKVTTTTSFLYDMTKVLAGDYVDVDLIIPAGEDPHLYIPKTNDAKKISDADLVLFHGLHFEGKMVDILEKTGVNLSENFPKEKLGEMDQDGEIIVDPHFWFDISLYKMATENAAKALSELVPEHKTEIEENLKNYLKELDELDEYNKTRLAEIPENVRFLITPHDAFNYFSRAYGIEVVAPQGVSTDSEVANKDIEDTANFIVEKKVPAIFAESTTDPARMEKLRELCKAKGFDVEVISGDGNELFSDSLAPEGQSGDNYIDMYKHNIDLIVNNLK
ncbi:zinc ABC transporter substrate-binding protein [Peptoniphilus sp. MSJ-1]|uniref:Zinc ABC transporter substrate-binding protein n=1 Tax=Peptoniphilus ovalis TaxID=2841503 RepID=A0ABS6FF98_9FIRM|nr:zinc ABC transporter substrate-binding protein [Peptoniphilus ovalis]MBU5668636.1 zinc ABC transporter substrate-binding protein [Peptoniphilus ovalis]